MIHAMITRVVAATTIFLALSCVIFALLVR